MSSPTPSVTSAAPASPQKPPSASLYVGDLAPDVNEGTLFELFSQVGPVASIRICRDSVTLRSLGYAYVNYHSVLDAERALDGMNNQVISGKPCRIMWSQRDPSIRKTGLGNIFIKNLDLSIGHKELYDTFSQFGNILSCKVAFDSSGKSKGYGFVHFENQSAAEAAVATVNDNILLEKKVYVGPFVPRKVRAQQLEKSWTNIFIKDIDPSIDDKQLNDHFSVYGTVTSAVVMRKPDGTHLGFGFVNFVDNASAVAAVEGTNGKKLGPKVIYSCRAQKKAERQAKLRREWEQLKISKYQGINLYIKNIEDDVDEERLKKEFAPYGNIKSCKIMMDDKGNSKGFGFVCFETPEESQLALSEMNNRILPGLSKPLYVALHEPKEVRRQKLSLNAYKGIRPPQGTSGALPYTGQPVYYGGNIPQGYVYPQQILSSMPHGWQPQYPVHAGYTSGQTATTTAATRGGASRGGGVAATKTRRNPTPQAAPAAPPPTAADQWMKLPLEQVKQLPLEHQKLYLGEQLYMIIAQDHPLLAGKITGMFLDAGWSVEDLFAILLDVKKLNEKVEDAISVLEKSQADVANQEPEGV